MDAEQGVAACGEQRFDHGAGMALERFRPASLDDEPGHGLAGGDQHPALEACHVQAKDRLPVDGIFTPPVPVPSARLRSRYRHDAPLRERTQ
jgi:hypothetical protein